MKPPQYLITLILSAICLFLSIMTIWQGHSLTAANLAFETQKATVTKALNDAQAEINRGNSAYQYISVLVQDIATLTDETKPGGEKDEALKNLLISDVDSSGVIKINAPSPSPSPAAATSPSPTSH